MYLKGGGTMETGKNIFTIEFESGRIKDFEKRILTESARGPFLPMSFIKHSNRETVNYDCSGYISIAGFEIKNSMEMIMILEKCAFALIDACGYLINPRKIELNTGTVFYSDGKKEIRFAYMPRRLPAENTRNVFTDFLSNMENCPISKEMTGYLRSIRTYVEYSGGSLFDIINYIGVLKQEIHACGWEK